MRRTLRFIPALAALFFMGACATTADAAANGYGWFAHEDAAEVKLAYGAPDSDDVHLMLTCDPGSGQVQLGQAALRPVRRMTLASGAQRSTFSGQSEADPASDGFFVSAQARVSDPVLQRFRDTGRIALFSGKNTAELPASAEERARIRRFFQVCGAA